ncbi:FecCD family ABC transporter permease [Actinocorallia sp. A-T 12471]|uniref:FecCD family ABC transporter permease n=1 Tax=Actinocorallia sp. A-T 12471 TaxID=3089813 RepID=UPI0029D0C0C3|nr:iron chelate uptake ABC transporter family permease subunit [Actinocorallia sp. A-T 12471]MDX6740062.1 iron chelate uptake ABC transporter family permease subunit [Actinocorallia sp. A-T 12471]
MTALAVAWRMWRLRFRTRGPVAGVFLLGALALVAVYALGTGDFALSPDQVVATLRGQGPPGAEFVVFELRLPRLLVGIGVGMALGVAGAVFQSLTRNPLGSPDVVGFTVGAASGGILVLLLFGAGTLSVAFGAVGGGLATAVAVYLLAMRGGVAGTRLILVGIGVAAMLEALNAFLLSRASVNEAQSATAWLVGSLNARGWEQFGPLAAALVVLGALMVLIVGDLRIMELGDDTAAALGVRVQRTRLIVMGAAVGLTAIATATAGPVQFIALTAPPVAKFLTRSPGPNVLASAFTGAVLLTVSDLAAQRIIAPTILPVGIMTGAIGGVYVAFLLIRGSRIRSG